MPNLGGSRPIMVPTMRTDIPMNPVLTKTRDPTKTITLMIICCNGIAACRRSIPMPTYRIIGMAIKPAARVMASRRMKSAVGSRLLHVSTGYIALSANVAPDLERLMMYKNPRTHTVTEVFTAERIAIISKSCFVC